MTKFVVSTDKSIVHSIIVRLKTKETMATLARVSQENGKPFDCFGWFMFQKVIGHEKMLNF